jgi:hypothetical protein
VNDGQGQLNHLEGHSPRSRCNHRDSALRMYVGRNNVVNLANVVGMLLADVLLASGTGSSLPTKFALVFAVIGVFVFFEPGGWQYYIATLIDRKGRDLLSSIQTIADPKYILQADIERGFCG